MVFEDAPLGFGVGSVSAITLTGVLSRPLASGTFTHSAVITTTSYDLYPGNNIVPYGVYINNIAPVITPTILSVSEAALDGSEVGMVDVFDANGDTLAFTVTAGNEDSIFAVNGPAGLVTVAARSNLDYETRTQYVLDVDASDGVFSATSVVTINVVDADVDLALLKTVTPTHADPGDMITYTLIFSNVGGDVAAGVVITDWLPFSVTVQSVISSGNVAITRTVSSQTLEVFETSRVSPGGSGGIITLTAQLGSSLSASTVTNTATITTTSVESDTANNTAEAGLIVQNVAPVAEDDDYAATYETRLDVDAANGVLNNDTDARDDSLTAMPGSGPISGTLSLNLDGSFIYTPTTGFSGLDSFGYVVSDGALTSTATVFIDVSVAPTYTLTIAVDGTGSGMVTPTASTHVYTEVQVVTLTATANPDSEFAGWSGALNGTTSPVTLTIECHSEMACHRTVTATFDLLSTAPTYMLSVIISPTLGGDVLLNPPGGVYTENAVVELTANPAQGYEFIEWSGDLVGIVSPATITMTRDMIVTASFRQSGFDIYLPLVLRNY